MDKMTEEDVINLKIGDTIYDVNNNPVIVLDKNDYTYLLKVIRDLGYKRSIYERPDVIQRRYTLHKREYSTAYG